MTKESAGRIFLALIFLVLPLVQVGVFLQTQLFLTLPDTLNYGLSILAYYWMLNNVLLSARVPWFQNSLPYDARVRYHILSTGGIGIALFYHGLFKIADGRDIDVVSWSLAGFFVLLVAVSLLWIPLPGFRGLRVALLKRLNTAALKSYDLFKSFHILLFLVLSGLMYVHVIFSSLLDYIPEVSAWGYSLPFFLTLGFYLYSRIRRFGRPRGVLTGKEDRAGILVLRFRPLGRLAYRAGQFAFLRFLRRDLPGEDHPFSYLSSPAEDTVAFAVRSLGDFTRELRRLEVGDEVEIDGGYGSFRPGREPSLCFIASGIGAVPFLSVLKDLQYTGDQRPVLFHLAVNSLEEIPEGGIFDQLRRDNPRLKVEILSADRDSELFSEDYFRRHIPDPGSHSYYICSSPGVRQVITQALRQLGVAQNCIRYEGFTLG